MSQGSLARRYAKALIELSVGSTSDSLESVEKQLAALGMLFRDHAELFSVLCNYTLPHAERKNVLKEIFPKLAMSEAVQHFILLLVDKKRLVLFSDIAREFSALADVARGIVRAKVRYAKGIDEKAKANIQKQLERISGKKISCDFEEDANLIGGVVTTIGFTEIDGSIATQINEMKKQLISQKVKGN